MKEETKNEEIKVENDVQEQGVEIPEEELVTEKAVVLNVQG